ncbi:pentapeptide repeat-containing protein [Streptomyces sp. NPDC057575]|uniref:pentapeptide repeat-containing protein n=1 Tax=unclassified Streptomyces TaxID=2593676 RepID=UPI0036867CE4
MTAAPTEPAWPYCGRGADPAAGNPFGCRGRSVEPYTACLAHLANNQRDTYLASLAPGSDLDHRGTELDEHLLSLLLSRLLSPDTQNPRTGNALFDWATFTGDAYFTEVTFTGHASFRSVTFAGHALFNAAAFTGGAWFNSATFIGDGRFNSTTFTYNPWFRLATFFGTASFNSAAFESTRHLGPILCAGVCDLSSASFASPVSIEVAARRVVCRRTRWASIAGLRLRYAELELADSVLEYPLILQL